jgi:CRP/FNR family transcriptional regulator, anaerobic regulatory protein
MEDNIEQKIEELLNYLDSIRPLTKACRDYLKTVVKFGKVKKGTFLLKPGRVNDRLYFIRKGLLRCYYLQNGRELTDWFFWEGDAVVSIDSFYDQVLSSDFIEALENSEVYWIEAKYLDYAYEHFDEFNFIGRVLTTKYLRIWHRLARRIRFLKREERIKLLLKEEPGIFQRVPAHVLATYFDMSPETFSRLRGKKKA